GAVKAEVAARKPLSMTPKLPMEITSSDKIEIPVTIANDTDADQRVAVAISPSGLTLSKGSLTDQATGRANAQTRRSFMFQPTIKEGTAGLQITGKARPVAEDLVDAKITVVPEGFPVIGAQSDVLEKVARHEVELPKTWVRDTLKCQVHVYPS